MTTTASLGSQEGEGSERDEPNRQERRAAGRRGRAARRQIHIPPRGAAERHSGRRRRRIQLLRRGRPRVDARLSARAGRPHRAAGRRRIGALHRGRQGERRASGARRRALFRQQRHDDAPSVRAARRPALLQRNHGGRLAAPTSDAPNSASAGDDGRGRDGTRRRLARAARLSRRGAARDRVRNARRQRAAQVVHPDSGAVRRRRNRRDAARRIARPHRAHDERDGRGRPQGRLANRRPPVRAEARGYSSAVRHKAARRSGLWRARRIRTRA